MNSLVLKPWRWVVFLGVIPGTTPCSGLLRPSALATGATRRAVPREACEVRRTGPAAVFFAPRLAPGEALFGFLRIFPAPNFWWFKNPLHRVLWFWCRKKMPPPGGLSVQNHVTSH